MINAQLKTAAALGAYTGYALPASVDAVGLDRMDEPPILFSNIPKAIRQREP